MTGDFEDTRGGSFPPFFLADDSPRASIMPTLDRHFMAEWRKSQKLSQAAFAKVLGVNISAIKKWEGGERRIPPFMGLAMAAIAKGLAPVADPEKDEPETAPEGQGPDTEKGEEAE